MVHWRDLLKKCHDPKFQSALFCTLGVIAHGKSIATHRLLMVDVQHRHQEIHGEDRRGRGLNGEEGMRKRKVKRNEKKRTTTQAQNHFWMLMKPNLYENVDVLL